MMLLPIVDRELRVRARGRGRGMYRARLGAALLSILFVGGLLVATERLLSPGKVGQFMFLALGGLAFAWCWLEGVRTTADCLSQEKRRGTLGLLFLTRLQGYDVVLGKLAGHGLGSLYTLLALVPALAVPLTLGGVTGGEFWRLVLVLGNTLFLSLSLGMLVSALCVHERPAWAGTLLLLAVLALAPLVAGRTVLWASSPFDWLALSPTVTYAALFDGRYMLAPSRYWYSLLGAHLLGWLGLGLASAVLPRTWRQRASGSVSLRSWLPRALAAPRQPGFSTFWTPANPVAFLVSYRAPHPWLLGGLLALLACSGLLGWSHSEFDGTVGLQLLLGAVGIHLGLSGWMAGLASHAMATSRDQGMLELLLTTPLTPEEIIRGHHLGLWHGFAPAVTLLAVLELFGLAVLGVCLDFSRTPNFWILLPILGFLAVTLHDLAATAWFGLWMGLTLPKPSQAWGRTVLLVLLLPAAALVCCTFLWPIVGLVKNVVFIRIGRDGLRGRLRQRVSERFAASPEAKDFLQTPPGADPSRHRLPPVLPG